VAALRTPEGIIERLYFGDTGGAVWRVDLPPNRDGARDHRKAHWFLVKLADLGADADEPGGSARDDRRFFHPPDIVRSFDEFGQFDGVLIQSGNRAEPDEIVVENALFYIKDRVIVSGSETLKAESNSDIPLHYADLPDQTRCIAGSEGSAGGAGSAACADRALALGWKIRYLQAGEKGLSAPLTDGGRVFASTYVPAQNPACPRQPGEGHMRVVRLANGTAAANLTRVYDLGPGIPDAVEAVGDMILLPGRGADLYDLDGDGDRDLVKLLPSDAAKLYPTYWREPGVDPL
jgi:type IV pilus assembly protein PilY1